MSVISGSLRVYCLSEEGREVTLYRVTENEVCILSASCLMDSIVFDVLIEAAEDTKVCIIPSDALHKIEQENISLELYIYKNAAQKFSQVLLTLQEILFLKTDVRLARFLYEQFLRHKTQVLTLKQEEIASEIGSVREVVSRTLKYIAEEGLIKNSRGKIEIIDLEALKSLKDGN